MDPGTAMAAAAVLTTLLGTFTGEKGKKGSTYSKNAQKSIDEVLEDIRGMRGAGTQDITQNQGYQQGQEWLNSLFNDPEFFKNIEAPMYRDFEEKTIPELANRFASMGSGGATGSSGFRNQLAREGSNLHTNLAAMRTGLQQQGVNQQLGYAQQPVTNFMDYLRSALVPTQNTYQPPSPGIGAVAAPLWSAVGNYYGAGGGQNNNQNNQQQQGQEAHSIGGRFAGQHPGTY